MSPGDFRELRLSCLLNRKTAAKYLGVCLRTIRHWDAGRNRVPWSVVRLLRVLRCGGLGALVPEWSGWIIKRGKIFSPDGRGWSQADLGRWWLILDQARLFRDRYDAETPRSARPMPRAPWMRNFARWD
ncbi:VC1465 family Xer recombination activation factor [Luteibacter yeojuensis]